MQSVFSHSDRAPHVEQRANHPQHGLSFRKLVSAAGAVALAVFVNRQWGTSAMALATPVNVTTAPCLPLRMKELSGRMGIQKEIEKLGCLDTVIYEFSPQTVSLTHTLYKEVELIKWQGLFKQAAAIEAAFETLKENTISEDALDHLHQALMSVTLLTRDRHSPLIHWSLDDLWLKLADLYIEREADKSAEQILLLHQETPQRALTLHRTSKVLLDKLTSIYLDHASPEKAVRLIDQLEIPSNEFGENDLKDDSVRKIATHYLLQSRPEEAIETLSRLEFEYERACYIWRYLVPLALREGDIASAEKMAHAIPVTVVFGNIQPYDPLPDVLESAVKDEAFELIQFVASTKEKRLSNSAFEQLTLIRWF